MKNDTSSIAYADKPSEISSHNHSALGGSVSCSHESPWTFCQTGIQRN